MSFQVELHCWPPELETWMNLVTHVKSDDMSDVFCQAAFKRFDCDNSGRITVGSSAATVSDVDHPLQPCDLGGELARGMVIKQRFGSDRPSFCWARYGIFRVSLKCVSSQENKTCNGTLECQTYVHVIVEWTEVNLPEFL